MCSCGKRATSRSLQAVELLAGAHEDRELASARCRDRMEAERMRRLETLTAKNFKSIREQTLRLNSLNVFIGGNGSGKSNLVEVFRFLREIVNQNLGAYTARKGGADALLHFGRKTSPLMELNVEFSDSPKKSNAYKVSLVGTN